MLRKQSFEKSATVMLVRTLCWWLYDGSRPKMLVTESVCWQFFTHIGDFFNINHRPSSWWHQHKPSPISFTNIDVNEKSTMMRWLSLVKFNEVFEDFQLRVAILPIIIPKRYLFFKDKVVQSKQWNNPLLRAWNYAIS